METVASIGQIKKLLSSQERWGAARRLQKARGGPGRDRCAPPPGQDYQSPAVPARRCAGDASEAAAII